MATDGAPMTDIKLPEGIKPNGLIEGEISNFSTLGNECSLSKEFSGISWELVPVKASPPGRDSKLCFYIYTNRKSESTLWKCDFTYFILVKNQNSVKNILYKRECKHDYNVKRSFIIGDFWSFWNDPEQGFVIDDKLKFDAYIYIKNVTGLPQTSHFDFSTATENLSDVILLIGDKKIHVSKQILALHSPVLRAMFYGEFAEKNKKEIELKDIEYDEFIELLNVIYPSSKEITDESAEYLLKLGDRFHISLVVNRAEQFLIAQSRLTTCEKLRISDKYMLSNLQDHCLSKLATQRDIKAIKVSPVYKELSETTRVALFERMTNLVN